MPLTLSGMWQRWAAIFGGLLITNFQQAVSQDWLYAVPLPMLQFDPGRSVAEAWPRVASFISLPDAGKPCFLPGPSGGELCRSLRTCGDVSFGYVAALRRILASFGRLVVCKPSVPVNCLPCEEGMVENWRLVCTDFCIVS